MSDGTPGDDMSDKYYSVGGVHNVWLGVIVEDLRELDLTGIHWVIIGGESGPGYRTMNPHLVDSVIEQCRAQDVAVWFKQWGGNTKGKGGRLINGQVIQEWPV